LFTGLIETTGKVTEAKPKGGALGLGIAPEAADFEIEPGDSVAVDGLCLTVVERSAWGFRLQVSSESLARSTLGELRVGGRVNLERALRLSDRLGGHLVQGHVDGVGRIEAKRPEGEFVRLAFSAPAEVLRYAVEKGSVAVDGISLTVNGVSSNQFWVMLIPETLRRTALGEKPLQGRVNLEADLIAKYVERLLAGRTGGSAGLTLEKLKEEGFR
jgi:riboflavin synthase